MNTLLILGFQLTVGMPEIIIALAVALVLGFSISFFWNAKKNININQSAEPDNISENDNWKLKYYNDMDMQERAQQQLRERLAETRENEQILNIEVEELRKEIDDFENRLSAMPAPQVVETKSSASAGFDYLTQLKSAQEHLVENNNTVSRLVGQIELLKESESKYSALLKENEDLTGHLTDLKKQLTEKENEVNQIRQQQRLGDEMNDRLNKA